MPLPYGDIKEEFEVENVDHDEFVFGVQVTGQMGGNQNPINEATDDDAPPLVDGSTSGNEKGTIGEPQAIKRKRTSKDKRSSEKMPSSNHTIRSYGSSTLKNADDGVKQFQVENLATVECDTGKGQKGTENDERSEHSSSENLDITSDGEALIPTAGPSQLNKKAAGKSKTAKPNPLERQFKCINECGRSYKSKSALNLHLKTNCGEGGPKFLCEQCGSKFKQRADLKRHVIRIHKIDPSKLVGLKKDPKVQLPFKCEKCQSSYKYKGSLNSHLKFDCGLCPTFSCTQCSYRAKKKGNLRQHLEQVHNVDRSQLDNFGTAALDARPVLPFKCELCNRTYKTKKYLKYHLKYDCGLDPSFPCPKCKYRASRKWTLTSHLKNIHGAGGPSQS